MTDHWKEDPISAMNNPFLDESGRKFLEDLAAGDPKAALAEGHRRTIGATKDDAPQG